MANKNNKGKPDVKVIAVRVICIVLALLMFGGIIAGAIISANAESIGEEKRVFNDDDYLMRVGVSYGSSTLDGHQIRTVNGSPGYDLYITDTNNSLTYIYTLECDNISVSESGNLRRSVTSSSAKQWYYYRSSSDDIQAGGYHIQSADSYADADTVDSAAAVLAQKTEEHLYPAYISGAFYIRIGAYTSKADAENALPAVSEALGIECTVTEPTDTDLTVLDYFSAELLFEFDIQDPEYGLGFHTINKDDFIKVQKGYYYDGVFEFRRYKGSGVNGVSMILISEIERYVMCVVPWEIYNTWPAETIKAFSICARTYAIAYSHERAKHKQYLCDVCTQDDCQVCKGFERVNQNIIDGVNATKGKVIICDGKTITTYYNDLGGGSVAAAHEVWNQAAQKYLVGQMTPWEDLSVHKYGAWRFTVSPSELCTKLRDKGYTTLKGEIADIRINRLCENSTYVYSVTVTDTYGTEVTIERAKNVRAAFSGLLYAANFVIEHNGRIEDGKPDTPQITYDDIYVMTGNGIKKTSGEADYKVITSSGVKTLAGNGTLNVRTSSLISTLTLEKVSQNAPNTSGSSDFVFIGSGYGHGAGASQWGCKDLGNLGYKYDQILYTYYPNTEIVTYNQYLHH